MLLPSSFLRRLAPEERLATDGQRRVVACGLRSTWRPQGPSDLYFEIRRFS